MDNIQMQKQSPSAYKAAFTRRVLTMRLAASLTQDEVAAALGIGTSSYQHYEASERKGRPGRSYMPHHLIPAFCKLTGFPSDYLFGLTNPGGRTAEIRLAE